MEKAAGGCMICVHAMKSQLTYYCYYCCNSRLFPVIRLTKGDVLAHTSHSSSASRQFVLQLQSGQPRANGSGATLCRHFRYKDRGAIFERRGSSSRAPSRLLLQRPGRGQCRARLVFTVRRRTGEIRHW